MIVMDQRVSCDGFVDTSGRCLGVFYAYDGTVGLEDADWMQHSMNIPVAVL